ncbi:unnamed protein product [Caenorhabditis angaria]|uniref:Uncharacterized protein n=1 Tax=Caenorhabditis angaria TaxID=860376 RepID=A0A9P1IRM3_9PELO|nr:unnamed protein product [Caenorhabditis angaria]
MYPRSMTNGLAASLLFFIFLFFLARHIRNLDWSRTEDDLNNLESGKLPPAYNQIPSSPPPTYQEAIAMKF